jgi:hypothetical protein
MTRKAFILLSILTTSLPGFAQSSSAQTGRSYSYAHISYVEGEVTLQRAIEPEPSEAGINVPVTPGDRAWTATHGRAEILYGDGSLLRMDERTKVDFVAFGETTGQETLVRLWNGSIILRLVDVSGASFRVDTPAGSIFPVSEGVIRIDVDDTGTATLSVYEGVAELASEGGSVLVRSGQRSLVQPGLRPEPSFEFNTARWDAFASWSDGRDQLHRHTKRLQGVPDEVAVYTGELDHYGNWRYESSYGYVWYPTVSVGWSPYTYGRWGYTSFGWTWISHEPWGWAPYHYGRWGHGSFGWYWIPGSYWGPAWVSWAFGPSWVGWCPLGYYDRPVYGYRSAFYHRGGHAVPRHRGVHGWRFAKNEHFASRSVEHTRLRVDDVRATSGQARVLESGAILDRQRRARVVGPAAMTRASKRGLAGLERETGSARTTRGRLATTRASQASQRSIVRSPRTQQVLRGSPAPASRGVTARSPGRTVSAPERVQQSERGAATARGGISNRTRGSQERAEPSTVRSRESGALRRMSVGSQRSVTGRGAAPEQEAPGQRSLVQTPGSRSVSPSAGAIGRGATTRAPTSVTRRPATPRSKGSSAGSKDFFSRRPPSVSGSRSSGSRSTAKPRSGSTSSRPSSQGASSSRSRSSSNKSRSNKKTKN